MELQIRAARGANMALYRMEIGSEVYLAIETEGYPLVRDDAFFFEGDIPKGVDAVDEDTFNQYACEVLDDNGIIDTVTIDQITSDGIKNYFEAIIREVTK